MMCSQYAAPSSSGIVTWMKRTRKKRKFWIRPASRKVRTSGSP
jgi:hypothetical protein